MCACGESAAPQLFMAARLDGMFRPLSSSWVDQPQGDWCVIAPDWRGYGPPTIPAPTFTGFRIPIGRFDAHGLAQDGLRSA